MPCRFDLDSAIFIWSSHCRFSFRSYLPCRRADEKAKLAFNADENGQYTFDTGVLKGVLQPGGKAQGLASVVHIPSGTRLDQGAGIFSFYRVLTKDKRYGAMAWDWPSTSKVLPDGAVNVYRGATADRPFDLTAIYRWTGPATLDLEVTVKAVEDWTVSRSS